MQKEEKREREREREREKMGQIATRKGPVANCKCPIGREQKIKATDESS